MHVFALFIFLLIPQDTHPHMRTHNIHKCTYIYTPHTLYQRWLRLFVNKLLCLYLFSHTQKWLNSSTEVCFPAEKKRISLIFPRCDVCESLLSRCSVALCVAALKQFSCLNDVSLSKNLNLVNKNTARSGFIMGMSDAFYSISVCFLGEGLRSTADNVAFAFFRCNFDRKKYRIHFNTVLTVHSTSLASCLAWLRVLCSLEIRPSISTEAPRPNRILFLSSSQSDIIQSNQTAGPWGDI